ncbi:lecithin retinol acyltransferase family protein [endosymbiont GvMRE of Glomus versiforme]|uniref:lecithin retinol acyltransferase family protein n=1 Tax=endosymbiont GvMRE of Glomus versiforme TaxID=2039283 RepID=UPI000EE7277A|nr:lecithin retinol acyltransferase family protein [endosymbiont GvMRE of Glomus versiforme]RHZ35283.1 hypothetical protein GvMRE_IIg130 [endosymbiont GvMRE of Glomus versiforme]
MTRKNLWSWWYNGIDDSEKNRLEKIGIDAGSCSSKTYYLNDLKKILENESVLKRRSHSITGQIHFIIFFSTWFNNDCMVVINGYSNYTLWICVYEDEHRHFGEWFTYNIVSTENDFSTAKNEAWTLRWKMEGNNPVIYRHLPLNITYYGESSSPEMSLVSRSELSTTLSNPDQYIRPLDIVKVYGTMNGRSMLLHSGIYLGSEKVVHAVPNSGYLSNYLNSYGSYYGGYGYGNYYLGYYLPYTALYGSIGSKYARLYGDNDERDTVEIVNWERFRKFWMGEPDKIVRIKTIIPFKHREDIIRHIAKAYIADSTYFDGKNKFSLADNNCEHLVNSCVLGLNFSEHGEIEKEKKAHDKGNNYHKRTRIDDLEDEINRTGNSLDGLTSSTSKVSDIKKYMSDIPAKYGKEFNFSIEVEPKYGYKFKN